jgi:RNA polymerase sigma factor (sigma-70 family)
MGADAPRSTWEVAEDVLVDRSTRARLCAYARSRFGIGPEDAEDLLQETALELLHHESYVRRPDGYVFAVFRSRCVAYVRLLSRNRQAFVPGAAPEQEELPKPDNPSPDLVLALRQALGGLSSRCKQLLCAYYVEGRTLTEAAGRFAIEKGSVTRSISRCIQRLRRALS